MVNLTIILLYLLSFLLIYQFVGYPSLMAMVALRAKSKNKDYSYQPFVFVSDIVVQHSPSKLLKFSFHGCNRLIDLISHREYL